MNGLQLAFLRGKNESCDTMFWAGIVHTSANSRQSVNNQSVAVEGSDHQRRISQLIGLDLVRVGVGSDEAINGLQLAFLRGNAESSTAALCMAPVNTSPCCNKDINHLWVVLRASIIQGREPFIADIVDIRLVLLQQVSHGDQVPSQARVDQGLVRHLALRLLLLGDADGLVLGPMMSLAQVVAVPDEIAALAALGVERGLEAVRALLCGVRELQPARGRHGP